MCGIAGYYFFNKSTPVHPTGLEQALLAMQLRGPDAIGCFKNQNVGLGHTRLSIIDTSQAANQPFTDSSQRYTLVFNGMIYNFRQLRQQLEHSGIKFRSESDTEVLLYWLIKNGPQGIKDLQGFFAFTLYDKHEGTLLIARDRFGVKPLYYCANGEKLVFASEMKALMAMGIPRKLDHVSLSAYLHLNYIPGPWTIFEQVVKLKPGHFMWVSGKEVVTSKYYQIEPNIENQAAIPDYDRAKSILREKLTASVRKRLVADVPLGTFLSGGIDSSIVTAIAAGQVSNLNTFSIGFADEPMFDETHYARSVAKMYKTNHTEFRLTTNDMLGCLFDVLDYTDEPFADSSALAVYILSRETRKKVTVALSGDGADELFAGYNKHMAEWKIRNPGLDALLVKHLQPILSRLPQSRNNFVLNKFRQLNRFGQSMGLDAAQRYWQWAGFATQSEIDHLVNYKATYPELDSRKDYWLKALKGPETINEVLLTDMQLVLPYDMLTKVDLMSMANSLEVRVPFLDHDLVNFVFGLPGHYKIDCKQRKKILRETFRHDLPPELFTRNKQGFEVPLLRWFRRELKSLINDDLLSESFVNDQNLFNYQAISQIKNQLWSNNPGDSPARIWALIVFQHWYKKYIV